MTEEEHQARQEALEHMLQEEQEAASASGRDVVIVDKPHSVREIDYAYFERRLLAHGIARQVEHNGYVLLVIDEAASYSDFVFGKIDIGRQTIGFKDVAEEVELYGAALAACQPMILPDVAETGPRGMQRSPKHPHMPSNSYGKQQHNMKGRNRDFRAKGRSKR